MDIKEIYSLIFTDSLTANLAFNPYHEMAINSAKIFGLYNSYMLIIIASLAFSIASALNYIFGIACFKILSNGSVQQNFTNIEKLKETKYINFLLILSMIPFLGNFVVLFAGFCRFKFLTVILISTIAKFIYYTFFILLL